MSLPKLFKILPPNNKEHPSEEALLFRLQFAKNSSEGEKVLHDLNTSVASLRMNIQIQRESIQEPTPRDIKKFQQLNDHITRLQAFVDQLAEIFNGASDNK